MGIRTEDKGSSEPPRGGPRPLVCHPVSCTHCVSVLQKTFGKRRMQRHGGSFKDGEWFCLSWIIKALDAFFD